MEQRRLYILDKMPIPQALFKLAIPTMLGMLVQIFYNITDTFFVGKLNDPNQVAAVALTMPLFMTIMALSGIFGNGGASYLSRLLGQKDCARAQKTLATALFSCTILGIIIVALGLLGMEQILSLSGTSPQTAPFAAAYLRIILIGSVMLMLNFAIGQLLRAEGAAKEAMFGMVIGTMANIVLDPLFIFTFKLGVSGAAVATVLGNIFGLLYYAQYYFRQKSLVSLSFKQISFEKSIYAEIVKVGLPASLNQVLMSAAQILMNNIAVGYGDVVVAAIGIDMRVFTIPIMLSIGLAIGAQPLIGYSYGAGNLVRLKSSIKIAGIMATGLVVVFTLLFVLFPTQLIRGFINDRSVIAIGARILQAMVFGLPFIGIQVVLMNALQAMGKGLPALIVSLSRQGLIFVPALLILNDLFGFSGFIYAMAVADVLTALLSVGMYLWVMLKMERSAKPAVFMPQTAYSDEGACS